VGGGHWPIVVAFAILAAYTYQSGLRAPALIAFVKDGLIYLVVIVAILYIPSKLGGWDHIFGAADAKFKASESPADGVTLANTQTLGYASLAFGSAMALFLYPHSVTGVLAAKSRDTIKRNMAALPAYSFILGMLALLGFMAIAADVTPVGDDANTVIPRLFDQMFGDVFAGVAFAAIGIGALVPAAIMSIAAANLFTRNIYKEYFNPEATPKQESQVAKIVSLVVKAGAVAVILVLDPQFSIDLQLIGGVLILMTLPPIVFGLFTRWFHGQALLAGLIVGLASGLVMLYDTPNPTTGTEHFGGSQYALSKLGFDTDVTIYTGVLALLANVIVAVGVTALLRALKRSDDGLDATEAVDYHVEAGDPQLAR
ncbi:MAG: solute:Na+ symporter, family, partial [Solirubrobacteraceae bacterium]|nr:solute:Na+ symporter, family [Solirubrobacteraceae bacterium]